MATSGRTRMQLRTVGVIVVVACIVAPIFNVVTNVASIGSAIQGLIDGVMVALLIGGWIAFVRDGLLRAWLRRWSFTANLVLNATALFGLFLVARGVGQVATSGRIARFGDSFADPHLLVALPFFAIVAFGLQFVMQMNRMVGSNVLRYFLAGVYHRPKEEERIFMFLDLERSTELAERLGRSTYYALLRRFVDDLTEPILTTRGEIYQYAGDEVVISWRRDRGVRDANCVRCFFLIREAIDRSAQSYEREFGVRPRFRAGMHGGEVIAGELGELKQEIVFVGDIVNTAARLEEYAKEHKLDFVVSGALVDQLELPEGVHAKLLDQLRPRGKEEVIAVHQLVQSAPIP